MAALKHLEIKIVVILVDGVPEAYAKHWIAYAPSNNKENLIRDDNKLILLASLGDSLEYVADSIERLGKTSAKASPFVFEASVSDTTLEYGTTIDLDFLEDFWSRIQELSNVGWKLESVN